MIQDFMIEEIQNLKLSGFTLNETYKELKRCHTKVPTLKTIRKYYNMDSVPEDNHANSRKEMAFAKEPYASVILEILSSNPDCKMSSIYDVLLERFVETDIVSSLPGNAQTLRHYINFLRKSGKLDAKETFPRKYDIIQTPPPGKKAQIDFGQVTCINGLTIHFICILLWHSRLLWVCAQDHKFNSEEACRAIYRFTCKIGGRVETLVIDQDSVFVTKEIYGEVFETQRFKEFLDEQEMNLWTCRKADPESKGAIENSVKFVKTSFFSARTFESIDDVIKRLPAWLERANSRIHQGTFKIPQQVYSSVEREHLRPLLPSVYEISSAIFLPVSIASQPYILHKSVKYSVPWDMCYTEAYKRLVGNKLYVYDKDKRYVCSHELCPVKGAVMCLEEHKRESYVSWIEIVERLRNKWNCIDFQHFVNGIKKENPERRLSQQFGAIERYLDEKHPDRAFVAKVLNECCEKFRYRFTQFKEVYEIMEAKEKTLLGNDVDTENMTDVDVRTMEFYKKAFDERCIS